MNIKNLILLAALATSAINSNTTQSNTVTLFSHGIADTWKQVLIYTKSYTKDNILHHNDHYLLHTPFASFNYPDATDKNNISSIFKIKFPFILPPLFSLAVNSHHETSFGQENEIGRLHKAYTETLAHYPNSHLILMGLSRGASNLLIFAGLYELTNIKAIVIESPYYTMSEVIESVMIKKNLQWLPLSYGETLAEFIFKRYTRHGWSPAKCIENISKEIPIFIVCSQEDYLVPCSSSMNVYKKLVESGHQHTYIFVTEYGKHAAILHGPEGEKYQWVVNAFYKKYNLPHCPDSAKKGKSLLSLCQPSL